MSDHEQTLRELARVAARKAAHFDTPASDKALEAEAACLSGADALVRDARCCGSCQHIDTSSANEGTGLCLGPTGSIAGWVPLTARCERWATRED